MEPSWLERANAHGRELMRWRDETLLGLTLWWELTRGVWERECLSGTAALPRPHDART